ncbi:MAG: hypothetical protein AAB908_02840 [Patescibacteria group bacterium]
MICSRKSSSLLDRRGAGKIPLLTRLSSNIRTPHGLLPRQPASHDPTNATASIIISFRSIDRFDSEESQGHIVGKRFITLFGGIHYGIYTPDLEQKLQTASVIFAPVDISGAEWLKDNYNATTIFIVPESLAEYRMRIHARNPEMPERELEERMHITEREVQVDSNRYDYRVVNTGGGLAQTSAQIVEILQKEGYNLG